MSEIEKLRKVAEAALGELERAEAARVLACASAGDRTGHGYTKDHRCYGSTADLIARLRAALAAPVEPAPTPPEIYRLGHTVGAEWMREQAALAVEDTDVEESGRGYMRSDDGRETLRSAARNVRSLPVSPPAPEEAK